MCALESVPDDSSELQVKKHTQELRMGQIDQTNRIASLQAEQQTMQTKIASLHQKRAQLQPENKQAEQHLTTLQNALKEMLQNMQVMQCCTSDFFAHKLYWEGCNVCRKSRDKLLRLDQYVYTDTVKGSFS